MISNVVKRNEELTKENEELRTVRKTLEDALKRATIEREYLQFKIDKLSRMLFGTSSEKLPTSIKICLSRLLWSPAVLIIPQSTKSVWLPQTSMKP